MTKNGLKAHHMYRKSRDFAVTCKELGLSMSGILNILVDQWLESKEVFLEAKMSLIKGKASKRLDNKK